MFGVGQARQLALCQPLPVYPCTGVVQAAGACADMILREG